MLLDSPGPRREVQRVSAFCVNTITILILARIEGMLACMIMSPVLEHSLVDCPRRRGGAPELS